MLTRRRLALQGQSTPLYHDEAREGEDGGFDVCLACAIPIIEANGTVWANPVQFALGLECCDYEIPAKHG